MPNQPYKNGTIQNVTLNDVARSCGLSISSVSKILSGSEQFKKETIEKVLQTVKELGYSPNIMARNMATKEPNKMIGFFVPNIMNPFFAELVNCVEEKLSQKGYMLTLCLYHDDPKKLSNYINLLINTRASGAMIACCREDSCEKDFELIKQYMSVVSVQADVGQVDRVDVTDQDGTYEMIEYLIQKGHKNIGFVGYRYDMSILGARLAGYKKALKDHHLPIKEEYICNGKHNYNSSKDMVSYLLDLPSPPTAIHCFNEFMAQGAYEVIKERGLHIPEDISLTGFDDITISRLLDPPLTTISNPIEILSDVSVDMLIHRMEYAHLDVEPQHVCIKHRFIERCSVKDISSSQ